MCGETSVDLGEALAHERLLEDIQLAVVDLLGSPIAS